ncbi:hypothetical protein DFH07DRAFT_830999 [Mycena maculata]|uniref:Uncharacterized protein n=1 Tax=Mycena maculata TaxID=230809 RepID=A0AAD7N6F0_9AGAR|nr:hypothetical protein DFH07DRAFT_830999 [Mycena maculata]
MLAFTSAKALVSISTLCAAHSAVLFAFSITSSTQLHPFVSLYTSSTSTLISESTGRCSPASVSDFLKHISASLMACLKASANCPQKVQDGSSPSRDVLCKCWYCSLFQSFGAAPYSCMSSSSSSKSIAPT